MVGLVNADEPKIVSVEELVEIGKTLSEEESQETKTGFILRLVPQSFEYTIVADNPLFKLSEGEPRIEIKDTIYVKAEKDDLKFSEDGQSWQSFEEMFTGSFSVGFSQTNGEEPKLEISLDFKKRD